MNEVQYGEIYSVPKSIKFLAKTREMYLHKGATAFIGSVSSKNEPPELFLITYDSIVKAEDPSVTWGAGNFDVKKFVDIKISIIS